MTTQSVDEIAGRLSSAQRRLVLSMRDREPKKWRAVYRDAKVRHWTQLPFQIARPTLTGSEILTALGQQVKAHLLQQERTA